VKSSDWTEPVGNTGVGRRRSGLVHWDEGTTSARPGATFNPAGWEAKEPAVSPGTADEDFRNRTFANQPGTPSDAAREREYPLRQKGLAARTTRQYHSAFR